MFNVQCSMFNLLYFCSAKRRNMKGLTPRIVDCMKGYSRETFMKDLMAGIIVGIVALPKGTDRMR